MKSKVGYLNILETTGNRQMEMGFEIFCVGSGEHSSFFIFSHTRKVSNPRLHLTVSCRFRNSFGIKFFPFRAQMGVPPLRKFMKPPMERTFYLPVKTKRENLFCGEVFRVFNRGQSNCYFNSAVKNTNMPQNELV